MTNDTPQKQNDISELSTLEKFRYENIFNVYQNVDNKYYYNLLTWDLYQNYVVLH